MTASKNPDVVNVFYVKKLFNLSQHFIPTQRGTGTLMTLQFSNFETLRKSRLLLWPYIYLIFVPFAASQSQIGRGV